MNNASIYGEKNYHLVVFGELTHRSGFSSEPQQEISSVEQLTSRLYMNWPGLVTLLALRPTVLFHTFSHVLLQLENNEMFC